MAGYYPIGLKLKGKKCVVVGGGRVAERKALSLLTCGARVEVVGPTLTSRLRGLLKKGKFEHKKRCYQRGDLRGALLVIATTDDEKINSRLASESQREVSRKS